MNKDDVKRLIVLLTKHEVCESETPFTFGEICELRELSYEFSDWINEEWRKGRWNRD